MIVLSRVCLDKKESPTPTVGAVLSKPLRLCFDPFSDSLNVEQLQHLERVGFRDFL